MEEETVMDNKKTGKKTAILLIFAIIIFAVAYYGYYYYSQNLVYDKVKNELLNKIQNNDLGFFVENNLYENIGNKMKDGIYDSSSNIKISSAMEDNLFSKLDLSKFQMNHSYTKNNVENKTTHTLKTNYAGNHLLTVDFINNGEKFAVKSDEIVNRYVGINKGNTQNTTDKLAGKKVDFTDAKILKEFIAERENINLNELMDDAGVYKYAKVLAEKIPASNFSKKENVLIELDSKQISTTEYTVNLNPNEVNEILNTVSEQIESDNELISKFVVSEIENGESENEILDYSDNDNISKVQGEQNNFNVTIEILDENTIRNDTNTTVNNVTNNIVNQSTNQGTNGTTNQTTNQGIIENLEQIINQTPGSNNTISNTTAENTVTNSTSNTEIEVNQIEENTNQEDLNQIVENDAQEPTQEPIEEPENLRVQGFISVNENDSSANEQPEFVVGENLEETIKNVSGFAKKIDWSYYLLTGAKVRCSEEEFVLQIQKILSDRIKQNNSLIIKMYIVDEKIVKLNFEIPETKENFDIEIISKGENEKYLNVTKLVEKIQGAEGHTISFYKKQSDTNLKLKVNINKIVKNKINEKTTINLETKGTINSKRYNTDMNVFFSNDDGEFEVDIENLLNFESDTKVEELNSENCLFIDELSDEELGLTWDEIKRKIISVLNEKNRNLNIIDINNSNSVVKQNEQIANSEENSEGKENAKYALIQTISNKMREYLDNGSQLKIDDLDGLEIPGYEVNISISSNLAIITVNGYRFNLDADFNLSDS